MSNSASLHSGTRTPTSEEVPANADDLRHLCLTLRDLLEHTGASSASLTFGATGLVYRNGEATIFSPGGGSVLPDDVLDEHGLVLARGVS